MSKLSLSVGAEPTPTGPADLRDAKWLAGRVAALSDGIDAARDIWLNWDAGMRVGRLHPTMSAGAYIESLGFHLALVDAMAALPNASLREIAAVAGVSKDTVQRRRRPGVSNATPDAPPAKVIGADGKSYPGRVVRPAQAEVIEPVDTPQAVPEYVIEPANQPAVPSDFDLRKESKLERFRVVLALLEGSLVAPRTQFVSTVRRRDRAGLAQRIRRVQAELLLIAYALEQPEQSTDWVPSTSARPPAGGDEGLAGPEALTGVD